MDLILTSFGASHLEELRSKSSGIFHRMPPIGGSGDGPHFEPDFAALLVAERVIIDSKTFELLKEGHHPTYTKVGETIRVLHSEGFVRLVDFDTIIDSNKAFLDVMLRRDLREMDAWVGPLRQSVSEWRRFARTLVKIHDEPDLHFNAHSLHHYFGSHIGRFAADMHGAGDAIATLTRASYYASMPESSIDEILGSRVKQRDKRNRAFLREILSEYLSYVNTNLLLANVLETGFYDWTDFSPFYKDKLLRVGQKVIPGEHPVEVAKQLFDLSFPEFGSWNAKRLVRALKDRRISDLRALIESAANGDLQFDTEFAKRTLNEVLKIEDSTKRIKNITSYVTLPLEFVLPGGGLIAKAAEEVVEFVVAKKKRRKHRWFYLLRDVADQ